MSTEAGRSITLVEHQEILDAAVARARREALIEGREQGAVKMRADIAAYAERHGFTPTPRLATLGEKKAFERAFDERVAAPDPRPR